MSRTYAPAARSKQSPSRVLLVCPPFQIMTIASLSVVLLATVLRESGIECEEPHLQFDLARAFGSERYKAITGGHDGLIAEMLFADAARVRNDAQPPVANRTGARPVSRRRFRLDPRKCGL